MKFSLSKVLCACLATVFLLLGLVSCKKGNEQGGGETTTPQQTSEDTSHLYDKNGYLEDQLPADMNFDRTLRVLGNLDQQEQFYAETTTDDRINNAIYARNETVCTRLGIDIDWDLQVGSWNKQSSFIRRVEIANQDQPYDAVVAYNLIPPAMAIRGLTANLMDTEYIDVEKPWWPSGYVEELVVADQIYSLAESCGVGVLKNMVCIFFNNSLIASKELESPYDLVDNNEWTLDKLMTMIEGSYEDLNSQIPGRDGLDLYGLCTSTEPRLDAWFYASGYRLSGIDGNGNLISLMGEPHVGEHIDRIKQLFLNSDDVYLTDDKKDLMFNEQRAVFYATVVSITDSLKNLDIDFGVVPMPKLNSEQEAYGTHLANGHDVWCIPKQAKDVNKCSSALLECMASESYRQVNAVYYDSQLKHRYSVGSQSAEKMAAMYDLIRESIVFDFTYVYGCAFEKAPMLYVRYCLTKTDEYNWSSTWGELGTQLDREFQKIVESFAYN